MSQLPSNNTEAIKPSPVESNEGLTKQDKGSELASVNPVNTSPEPTKEAVITKVDEVIKVESEVIKPIHKVRKDKGKHRDVPWLHKKNVKNVPKVNKPSVQKVQSMSRGKMLGFAILGLVGIGIVMFMLIQSRMKRKSVVSNEETNNVEPVTYDDRFTQSVKVSGLP